jgi:hypothetical protein
VKLKPNVFVIAFVLGAVALTVLPLLQRRMLRAPAPVATLPAWSLETASGERVGSQTLRGHVWLASFVEAPCEAACRERQESFGRALPHVDDLDGGVMLVSLGASEPSVPGWYRVSGPSAPAVIDAFREGWRLFAGTDAGTTPEEFARLPGFAVVDQNGAVRGFWKDDAAGRGNAINAARLLCQHGAQP